MAASTATHETSQSTQNGCETFDALLISEAWEAFNGWMSEELHALEAKWQLASSPRAWNGAGRQSRRNFNR